MRSLRGWLGPLVLIGAGCEEPCVPAEVYGCPELDGACLVEGGGLAPVDAGAFGLAQVWPDPEAAGAQDALLTMLPSMALADRLDALSTGGVAVPPEEVPRAPGVQLAFTWSAADQEVAWWKPQGITGSFDAGEPIAGARLVMVSWYYDADEPGAGEGQGARVSVVDLRDPTAPKYAHLLLVEPVGTAAAPSFAGVPIHAGGLAWVGNRLYVADTVGGLRAFNLDQVLEVGADSDRIGCIGTDCAAWGHRYVLPQVSRHDSPTGGCTEEFSFVALDASTDPPSLTTGPNHNDSIGGIVLRWPLDPTTGQLASTLTASEAYFAQTDELQGVVAYNGQWWLSASREEGIQGLLYRTAAGVPAEAYDWPHGPEDLAVDPARGLLWSATELAGERVVFAVDLAAVGG